MSKRLSEEKSIDGKCALFAFCERTGSEGLGARLQVMDERRASLGFSEELEMSSSLDKPYF